MAERRPLPAGWQTPSRELRDSRSHGYSRENGCRASCGGVAIHTVDHWRCAVRLAFLDMELDEVFYRKGGRLALVGHDRDERKYLVVRVGATSQARSWVRAQISPRALSCVRSGR